MLNQDWFTIEKKFIFQYLNLIKSLKAYLNVLVAHMHDVRLSRNIFTCTSNSQRMKAKVGIDKSKERVSMYLARCGI